MNKYILDASALLALLNSEPGYEVVENLLSNSIMSAVNVSEVVAELDKELDISSLKAKEIVTATIDKVIPLDFDQAVEIGRLRKITKQFGLSLGDRACIALALQLHYPIYTADKIWTKLDLDCEIILIR